MVWLVSGFVGLWDQTSLVNGFSAFGLSLSLPAIWSTCFLDLAIGVAVLARWRSAMTCLLQLLVVIGYTIALTFAAPALWLDPFGPLLKNLPFLVAVLTLAVLERER